MGWCPRGDELDKEIFDAINAFIPKLLERGERIAETFNVPVYCIKAMHRIGSGVAMKDLGQMLHCDPSFVTTIADALEQRDLARREPGPADRRVKRLVLTERGQQMKAAMEEHVLDAVPWAYALDHSERIQLLALIRKMTEAMSAAPDGSARSAAPAEAART